MKKTTYICSVNRLIEHIEYLVLRYDCVVMPGWGAFVARYESARYDDMASTYVAPSRDISYNPGICHDDGMLAASVGRKEGISYERASRLVSDDIAAMRFQLQHDGEISLGMLGKFVAQEGTTPLYVPSDIISASNFPSLKVLTLAEKIHNEAIEEELIGESRHSRMRRFGLKAIKVAASIAVAIGVGYGLLAPIVTSRNDDNMASVAVTSNAFMANSQTSITPVQNSLRQLMIAVPRNESATVEIEADLTESEVVKDIVNEEPLKSEQLLADKPVSESKPSVRFNSSDSYMLIVASLPTRAGAEKFIRETPGCQLDILEQDGKYRVYAATGSSSSEAASQKLRNGLSSRFPDAWVCRRN